MTILIIETNFLIKSFRWENIQFKLIDNCYLLFVISCSYVLLLICIVYNKRTYPLLFFIHIARHLVHSYFSEQNRNFAIMKELLTIIRISVSIDRNCTISIIWTKKGTSLSLNGSLPTNVGNLWFWTPVELSNHAHFVYYQSTF